MMKQLRTDLRHIRTEAAGTIVDILKRNRDKDADFCLGSTPVISEDPYDDNNTYTLDRVELTEDGEGFTVDASSCSSSMTVRQQDLPLDTLIEIGEFLQENEENIWDRDDDDDDEERTEFVAVCWPWSRTLTGIPGFGENAEPIDYPGHEMDYGGSAYKVAASWLAALGADILGTIETEEWTEPDERDLWFHSLTEGTIRKMVDEHLLTVKPGDEDDITGRAWYAWSTMDADLKDRTMNRTVEILDDEYEVVLECLDGDGNVVDFTVLESGFDSYGPALNEARRHGTEPDTRIAVWRCDKSGNVLDSWVVE